MLDKILSLWYNRNMNNKTYTHWDSTTVPVSVEERHDLSLSLGKAFAQSYKIHPLNEFTEQLLELYKESRRMVNRHGNNVYQSRYGAFEAYLATQ